MTSFSWEITLSTAKVWKWRHSNVSPLLFVGLPYVVCDVVRDAVIGDGEKASVLARFIDEMGDALLGL